MDETEIWPLHRKWASAGLPLWHFHEVLSLQHYTVYSRESIRRRMFAALSGMVESVLADMDVCFCFSIRLVKSNNFSCSIHILE